MPVIVYELKGDEKDLLSALKKSETAMRRTERAADKLTDKVEDFGKASSKAKAQGTDKLRAGLEGLKQGAEAFQGQIGGAAGVVEKFARASLEAGSALGPLAAIGTGTAGALAAVGFVVGTVATKLISFIEGAKEIADTLDARLKPGTESAAVAIGTFSAGMEGARAKGQRLQVLLAGDLANAFDDLPNLIAGVLDRLEPLIGAFGQAKEITEKFGFATEVMTTVVSGGLFQMVGLKGAMDDVIDTGAALNDTFTEGAESARVFADNGETLAQQFGRLLKSMDAQDKVADKAIRDQARALERLRAIQHTSFVALLDEEDKIRQAFTDREAAISSLEAASKDFGAAEDARTVSELRLKKELADLEDRRSEQRQKDAEAASAQAEKEFERNAAILKDIAAQAEASQRAAKAQREAVVSLSADSAMAFSNLAGALGSLANEGSTAFKALFAAQQAAAVGGIIVDTALAIMAALTLPPPMGEIAAATRAATGAAALATVLATSLAAGAPGPGAGTGQAGALQDQATGRSHDGGVSPDERLTNVLRNQGIINAPVVDALGGREGVDRLNRGQGMGRGAAPVVVQFRHQLYDATVPTSARIPGSALNRVQKNGARVGHSRRSTPVRKLTS